MKKDLNRTGKEKFIFYGFNYNPFGGYSSSYVRHYLLNGETLPKLKCDDGIISVLGVTISCWHDKSFMFSLNGLNPLIEGKLSTFFYEANQTSVVKELNRIETLILEKGYFDAAQIQNGLESKLNPTLFEQIDENFVQKYIDFKLKNI